MSKITLTKLVRRFNPRVVNRDEHGEPINVEMYERREVIQPFDKVEKHCKFCSHTIHVPQGTIQETCSKTCKKMLKRLRNEQSNSKKEENHVTE